MGNRFGRRRLRGPHVKFEVDVRAPVIPANVDRADGSARVRVSMAGAAAWPMWALAEPSREAYAAAVVAAIPHREWQCPPSFYPLRPGSWSRRSLWAGTAPRCVSRLGCTSERYRPGHDHSAMHLAFRRTKYRNVGATGAHGIGGPGLRLRRPRKKDERADRIGHLGRVCSTFEKMRNGEHDAKQDGWLCGCNVVDSRRRGGRERSRVRRHARCRRWWARDHPDSTGVSRRMAPGRCGGHRPKRRSGQRQTAVIRLDFGHRDRRQRRITGDEFGQAVGSRGTPCLSVRLYFNGEGRSPGGVVWVFERRVLAGTKRWVRTQKLVPDDASRDGHFGRVLAAKGKSLVVSGGMSARASAFEPSAWCPRARAARTPIRLRRGERPSP